MQVDYLIVGQGLCGTLLSRQLLKAGKSVLVIDDNSASASSRVAGGIINPVTGKRMVQSWLIDTLLPVAEAEYGAIEQELDVPLLKPCQLLDFHLSSDARQLFEERTSGTNYLHSHLQADEWQNYFRFNYGIGTISSCYIVNLRNLLSAWRQHMLQRNALIDAVFNHSLLQLTHDGIKYGDVTATHIIFCDGVASATSPWFEMLPWSKDKGEALLVAIPGLPRNHMYKHGISIVPWGYEDLFWVGASHDWKYTTTEPTEAFRKSVTERLDYFLRLPYEIVDHTVALRPANFDRKPFIGLHPVHRQIGIFNGMGGKGCSQAPYFAGQFCDSLTNGSPLMPDVSIERYRRVLSSG